MGKSMKQHIVNKGGVCVCGLKKTDNIKTAFIDNEDGLLYDYDCNPVTHLNMDSICTNCLKLYHPTHYNELIADRQLNTYQQSLPKCNRIRRKRNAVKRGAWINRIIHHNVIEWPLNGVITNPALLLPAPVIESPTEEKCKVIAKPKKKKAFKKLTIQKPANEDIPAESIIELTEKVNINEYEESFIQFNPNLAIVRGFGNFWKVIWLNDDSTIEDLSEWIPYAAAMNEAQSLAA